MAKELKRLEDYDVITKDDIQSNPELYKDIIAALDHNRTDGWEYMSEKRELFSTLIGKLTKPEVYNTSLVKIHTALQQQKAFTATFYGSDLQVSFSGVDMGDEEQATKLEMTAKYDKKAMKKDKKDIMRLQDLFNTGVGIEVKSGYDAVRNVTEYDVVSPNCWIPDRYGNFIDNDFEYHIFEMIGTVNKLKYINKSSPGLYFDLDKITMDAVENTDKQTTENKRLLSSSQDFMRAIQYDNNYVVLNGRKYIVTLTNTRSLIIRFEEIKPISKEEKKNPWLVPFPVNITNVYPLRYDPCGLAPLELIIDKQNAINRLENLSLFKAEYDAGFKHVAVDTTRVTNVNLLKTRPTNGPMYVPMKTLKGEPVSNATAPIETFSNVSGSTLEMKRELEIEAGKETTFTESNRGIAQPNQTLGQAKMQQQNSNVIFGLDSEMLSIGIQGFWKNIWYRGLQEHFPKSAEKVFRIGSGLHGKTVKFKKSDMLSGYDPDVTVESAKLKKERNRETLAYMMAQKPMIMQDPSVPEVSKKIFSRKLDEMNGLSNDLVYLNNPLTADERRAMGYLEHINNDITPKSLFRPNMDYHTYWVYFSQADNTPAKEKVLAVLESVMIDEGVDIPQESQEGQNGAASAMGSQLTSNVVSKQMQGENEPSLQQV